MTLGSDIARVMPEFRAAARSMMADTGRITRGGPPPVFDPVTGSYTPAAGTIIHEGPCRVRPQTRSDGETDVFGDTEVTTSRFLVTFPHDIANVLVDDVVTIVESGDPHIGLRSFRVVAVSAATDLIHRELGVETVE